jgi:hypothetical protein
MFNLLRHIVNYLLLVFTIGLVVGWLQPTIPTPTPTPVVVPAAPSSILPTPVQVAQHPTDAPTSAPPIAPSPLQTPEAIMPPFPSSYTSEGVPITGTPIPATPLVICTPQVELVDCYDELLDMSFSYPAFMGPVGHTMLRQGGYSGYGYEYTFEERESYAGGRSRDFSEGRGPRYTDQSGFNGQPAAASCPTWPGMTCSELSQSALLVVMLPQAEWLCSDAMMFTPIPRAILVLDLPEHPLINGFSFSFELMSAEATEAFREEWYMHGKDCEPETKAELSAAMEQLRQDLQAGTAAAEIQQRYDAMIQIAESVQSPFVAVSP